MRCHPTNEFLLCVAIPLMSSSSYALPVMLYGLHGSRVRRSASELESVKDHVEAALKRYARERVAAALMSSSYVLPSH